MSKGNIQSALLTATEINWLLGKVKVSKPYEYRIKSDIRKKLKMFTQFEIPLLINRGFIDSSNLSIFTQNLRTNPQSKDQIIAQPSQDIENCAQNMVGRKGFEPSNPAMSRRYLNQARPPARLYSCQVLLFCTYKPSEGLMYAIIHVII
jgi:hypothetical protein